MTIEERAKRMSHRIEQLVTHTEDHSPNLPHAMEVLCLGCLQAEQRRGLEMAAKRMEELHQEDAADGVTVGDVLAKEIRDLK